MKHPHLEASKETYWPHAVWAIGSGVRLILAGLASIIHGVYPGWFPGTAARTVIDLYHRRLRDHPNPEYQQYIERHK